MTETAKYADVFLPAALSRRRTAPSPTPSAGCSGCARRSSRRRHAARLVDPPGARQAHGHPVALRLVRRTSSRRSQAAPSTPASPTSGSGPRACSGRARRRTTRARRILHEGQFTRGKGLLQGIQFQAPAELPDDEYPMLLTTGRMLYHYNISTRISQNLECPLPHELAEVNPEDAAHLGVVEGGGGAGDLVAAGRSPRASPSPTSAAGDRIHDVPLRGVTGQQLTDAEGDPVTMTAEFKVCAVKMEQEPAGAWSRAGRRRDKRAARRDAAHPETREAGARGAPASRTYEAPMAVSQSDGAACRGRGRSPPGRRGR